MAWNDPHCMTQSMEEIMHRRHIGKEHGIDDKRHGTHHYDGLLREGNMMLAEEGELFLDIPELLLRRHE
jgi:hypothetical protein